MATESTRASAEEPPSQQKAPVPCYNCGSPDHLFTACPESTRKVPAGLAANVARNAARQNESAEWRTPDYGSKEQKYQKYPGHVVTKFKPQPPVVTRFAPPPGYQGQQYPITQVPPPAYQPQRLPGGYTSVPPNPPPYYQPQQPQQPLPPVQSYDQYNQHHGPPVLQTPPQAPLNYGQYSQPEYPPSQPHYHQQAPQYEAQYPTQHAPAQNYPNDQQHGYPGQYAPAQNYQNNQQHGYPGQQGPYPPNPLHQPSSNGYQQPDYAAYPYQPPANHNQQQGPAQWGQPPEVFYGQQQNEQHFNAPAPPYHAHPQQHYPHDGSYSQAPGPAPYNVPQMSPPVQQPQQFAEAQYASPNPQYNQPQPPLEQHYHGYNQNGEVNPQYAQQTYADQPAYPAPAPPPSNRDPSLARESRSGSIVSQAQGAPQPILPEFSDEEEIECMLERYLLRRMAKSGTTKSEFVKDLTTDEYYDLLCQEDITKPADAIGYPLPDNFDERIILPPAYDAKGVTLKTITRGNMSEFTKSIRDQPSQTAFARDPIFLEVDIDTWHIKFGRWVDQRCRVALGHEDIPSGPKTRKRTSSSREQDIVGGDVSAQFNHNKRPRIRGGLIQSNTLNSVPVTSAVEGNTTPSFDRETTPSFEFGECGQDGEEDPWAVEPGEGLIREDYKEPVDFGTSTSANGRGKKFGKPSGSQQPYYDQDSVPQFVQHGQGLNGWDDSSEHGWAPKRQDSGYTSARSSYTSTNGHGNNFSNADTNRAGRNGNHNTFNQARAGQRPRQSHDKVDLKLESPMSSDSDHLRPGYQRSENSPLTPTSTELLGHNVLPLQDQGKKVDPDKILFAPPKIRRAQPKVDAVYSRRW